MKLKITLAIIFSLILSNCATWYSATDPNYSKAIESSKPIHKGSSNTGSWGAWSYKAYDRSVSLKAPTGVMRYYEVEVFDLDSNGRFDTVFARLDGKWRFGSVEKMRKSYHMIDSGLSNDIVMEFINVATSIKKDVARHQAQEQYKKMIFEERAKSQMIRDASNIYPEQNQKPEGDWRTKFYE